MALQSDGGVFYCGPVSVILESSEGGTTPPLTGLPFVSLFPNPCQANLNIKLSHAEDGIIRIVIHNLRGEVVRILEDGFHAKGRLDLAWDGTDALGRECPSGIVLIHFSTAGPALEKWSKTMPAYSFVLTFA